MAPGPGVLTGVLPPLPPFNPTPLTAETRDGATSSRAHSVAQSVHPPLLNTAQGGPISVSWHLKNKTNLL